MDKKILLLEPFYKRDLPPLSFMKLSTKHKRESDIVKYHRGDVALLDFKPDIIYITTLFTWDYAIIKQTLISTIKKYPKSIIKVGGNCASLMAKQLKEEVKGDYNLHIGVDNDFENEIPDYDLFDLRCTIGFTTRGCCNKCAWCMVWRLEPEFIELDDWEDCLLPRFLDKPTKVEKILFMDNNFLAASYEHIKKVTMRLKTYNRPVDFNQGLDIALFKGEKAECFKGLKMQPLRFSWDGKRVDSEITTGLKLAISMGLKDIAIYCLYNFTETPQELYHRLRVLAGLGPSIMIFLMKYQPLDTFKKGDYIGKHWDKEMIRNFMKLRNNNFSNGILRFNNIKHFEKTIGKDKDEFMARIQMKVTVKKNNNPLSKYL